MATCTSAPAFPSPPTARGDYLVLHQFPSLTTELAWRACLRGVRHAAHYNAPEFFLEPFWKGSNPFAILALSGSRVVGVATGLHLASGVSVGLPSRPQICVDSSFDTFQTTNSLAQGIISESGAAKLITVYSWAWTPLPAFERHGFHIRQLTGNVVLDLRPGSSSAHFDAFPKNRRRDIRSAIRSGVEVLEQTTREDVASYWEVYCAWRKTERKKIHHNFTLSDVEITNSLRTNHRRFLARYQGKVVAASGFRFFPAGLIEYANNCSLDEYLRLLPNDLLMWRAIEWACKEGFSAFSMGGASPFLRKWGDIVPIQRYQLDRTLFHRHEFRETARDLSQSLVRQFPAGLQLGVRKLLHKQAFHKQGRAAGG